NAPAARLRPPGRDFGPCDLSRASDDRGGGPVDLRGPPDAALGRAALFAPRQAAPAVYPFREPEVSEPGLDQARRAGSGRPLRAAPGLPGGRRPATRRLAPRRA